MNIGTCFDDPGVAPPSTSCTEPSREGTFVGNDIRFFLQTITLYKEESFTKPDGTVLIRCPSFRRVAKKLGVGVLSIEGSNVFAEIERDELHILDPK